MALPAVAPGDQTRARRWDAVILGSGISALVCAARLGMAGQRVLVVEEEAASSGFPGLREPFFLAGARDSGLLDHTMRELTLSLIERRRIVPQELSYQVLGPELRLDVGAPDLSAGELVAWGLCKPELAHSLTRALNESSEAERKAMLTASLVRLGRRVGRGRSGAAGSHRRGLPAEVASPDPRLAPILAAQVRALSNLASALPGPECQARLLGSALAGGAGFASGPPWLHGMLRRRVEAVFGEFRTLGRRFRLVSVLNQPGIQVQGGRELWVGRALILAAPPTAIASQIDDKDLPSFLPIERPTKRRVAVHLRAERSILPEALSARSIWIEDPSALDAARSAFTLSILPRENDPKRVDLLARGVPAEGQSDADCEAQMTRKILALLPFSEGKIEQRAIQRPAWDCEDWLEDPVRATAGWPSDLDLRLHAKPPVYLLDRAWVAGLGAEGDLLLGLRAGDALATELG